MRKTVKFDRVVQFMIPVWHHEELKSSSKHQTLYKRPMAILELVPGKEYKCEELQALLNRGAIIPNDQYTYVCSHGFVPDIGLEDVAVSSVSTGLDPEEELN